MRGEVSMGVRLDAAAHLFRENAHVTLNEVADKATCFKMGPFSFFLAILSLIQEGKLMLDKNGISVSPDGDDPVWLSGAS